MEQINRIELQGNVGNIKIQKVGDNEVARISVATNYIYKGKDGSPVIETTWHSVSAWNGKGMPDFHKICKGASVHIFGRMRSQKFEGNDGSEKQFYEVLANRVSIVENEEPVQMTF